MKFSIIPIVSLCLLLSLPMIAQKTKTPILDGPQLAKKSFSLSKPETMSAKVMLQLISPGKAQPRIRNIEVIQQEKPKRQQFIEFISPQDIAGTKFLISERGDINETRMFTPGDGKVRVISSRSKKNSFMGTDFSYYDLENHDYEDFTFKLYKTSQQIKDKSFAGIYFSVVEAIPKDSDTPYDKTHYWIDEENFQTRRIEAFVQGVKVKEIYILRNISGIPYFIPQVMLAINHRKNGHRTVWFIQQHEINPVIEERVFSLQNLR